MKSLAFPMSVFAAVGVFLSPIPEVCDAANNRLKRVVKGTYRGICLGTYTINGISTVRREPGRIRLGAKRSSINTAFFSQKFPLRVRERYSGNPKRVRFFSSARGKFVNQNNQVTERGRMVGRGVVKRRGKKSRSRQILTVKLRVVEGSIQQYRGRCKAVR